MEDERINRTSTTTKHRDEYRHEGVRVGKAKYGKGVYAAKEFRKDDVIGPVAGEVIVDPNYGSDYGMDLGEHTLEPAAPFRYLNHSCEPNCELLYCEADEDDPAQGPQIWIEIIRDIARGEQMTIDYAWPPEAAIRCRCGSTSCRGWIVAPEKAEEMRAK
jgi:hypothetical protein